MWPLTRTTKYAAVLFLAAAGLLARQDPHTCGTHPLRAAEEIALHRQSQRNPALKARRTALRGANRDEGNIAVLEDAGDLITRRNPFNLNRRKLTFTPAGPEATAYSYALADADYDDAAATDGDQLAGLDDDDTREVALGMEFPFYGKKYTRAWINSDGNITFGKGDPASSDRSLGRAVSGPPRISGFFEDLDPSRAASGVRVHRSGSRTTVSWLAIPEFTNSGTGPLNTFQIRLHDSGVIEFVYSSVASASAVIGLAPGGQTTGTTVVSYVNDASAAYAAAVAERFTNVSEIDTVFAAHRFYETHDDSFDFIAFYNNQGIASSSTSVAWELTVRNTVRGINDAQTDDGAIYGSPKRLQGVLNMGPLSQYPQDPNAVVSGRFLAGDTPLSVLAHEIGHRWLAYVSVLGPGGTPAMLGAQNAHWGFAYNSDASLLEGNRIRDDGEGVTPRFSTIATAEKYSALDQYLMGFRAPQEVEDSFLVTNPNVPVANRAPQRGISFDGTRRDISLQELTGIFGPRNPDHTVAQRRFRVAVVLVTRAGQELSPAALEQLENYRAAFAQYFNRAADGRAEVDLTLRAGIHLSAAPHIDLRAGAKVTATVNIAKPAAEPLRLKLQLESGLVSVSETVTIPAGETSVAIEISAGGNPGVDTLTVSGPDETYAPAQAKLRVTG
ncbi:MAG: hypothetical protein FJW39_07590 [Acidobacteria bacterium]|nr:hypothetical protein [Acidobacteriota bacterium]